MKKTLSILCLILLMFSSALSVSANDMLGFDVQEPEHIALVSDSEAFNSKSIKLISKDKQSVEIKKSKCINSIDLDDVTNIIVDQETYKDMPNSDKRNLNQVLKHEINNKKEIVFLGNENTLNPVEICKNLDCDIISDISDLSVDTEVFAVSFSKNMYNNNVLSFYRTDCELDEEQALQCFSEIITADFENVNAENTGATEISTQKLASNAVEEDFQIKTYYMKNSSSQYEAILRTTMDVHRVKVKNPNSSNTVSTWEIKMHLDINPLSTCIFGVGAYTGQGNPNDEVRINSWPTTSLGAGSHSFSFGADSGVSSNVGYTYNIDFTDITLATTPVEGNPDNYLWAFSYKSGSLVSKYSSSLEVGSVYMNSEGNFTLEADSYIITTNGKMGEANYRFSLKDILVK